MFLGFRFGAIIWWEATEWLAAAQKGPEARDRYGGQVPCVGENSMKDPQNPVDFFERTRRILRVPDQGD